VKGVAITKHQKKTRRLKHEATGKVNTQLNKYFFYLGENHITCHVFLQMPCLDTTTNKDVDMRKTVYYPRVVRDDNDIECMFRSMVENNMLHLCSFQLQVPSVTHRFLMLIKSINYT